MWLYFGKVIGSARMDNETKGKAPNVIKAHCPDCSGMRNAYLRAEHVTEGSEDDYDEEIYRWSDTSMVLECCGCSRVFFRRDFWFWEWEGDDLLTGDPLPGSVTTTYWPAPTTRKPPKWIEDIEKADRDFGSLLSEMYTALNNDLRVLAAIGARTVFDRSSELLGVAPELSFTNKLDELSNQGKVSKDERDTLNILVNAGNAAAHRGWRPQPEELNTMMDVVETFLHRSFILGDGIKKLKAAIPGKPRKRNS
jgi:hypothetical protein